MKGGNEETNGRRKAKEISGFLMTLKLWQVMVTRSVEALNKQLFQRKANSRYDVARSKRNIRNKYNPNQHKLSYEFKLFTPFTF